MKLTVLDNGKIDLAAGGKGLEKETSLRTAVIVSLLSDRRANTDDPLPVEADAASAIPPDRKGWCGDALADTSGERLGSRLWLLVREKQTEETRRRAVEYIKEALQWMIEDGLATAVEVDAGWSSMGRLDAGIVIALSAGGTLMFGLTDITGEKVYVV